MVSTSYTFVFVRELDLYIHDVCVRMRGDLGLGMRLDSNRYRQWARLPSHSLGYQPLCKREEGSGNIAILLLYKWNVMNVIFTMLWTATQVAMSTF